MWFARTFPLLYSDYHCIGTKAAERLAAGQNLAAGKWSPIVMGRNQLTS